MEFFSPINIHVKGLDVSSVDVALLARTPNLTIENQGNETWSKWIIGLSQSNLKDSNKPWKKNGKKQVQT